MRPSIGIQYIVEQKQPGWTVSWEQAHVGAFDDRRLALKAAIRDARRVRNLGHECEVLVRRANGSLRRLPTRLLRTPEGSGDGHVA